MTTLPTGKIDIEGIRSLSKRLAGRVIPVEQLRTSPQWQEHTAEVWSPANHVPARILYTTSMVESAITEVMERPAPVPLEQRMEALEARVEALENAEE